MNRYKSNTINNLHCSLSILIKYGACSIKERRNTLAEELKAVNDEDRLGEQQDAHEQYYTRRRAALKQSLVDSERAAKMGGLHAGNEEYWQLDSDLKQARRKLGEASPLFWHNLVAPLTLTLPICS